MGFLSIFAERIRIAPTDSIMRHTNISTLHLLPLLIAAVLAVMTACADSEVDRRLDLADALMEAHPDSALTVLRDSTLEKKVRGEEQTARYNLLLSLGKYLAFEDETNDSLITTCVEYYKDHGPDSLLMKSLFLQGSINMLNKLPEKAVTPAMEALELARELDMPLWIGRTATNLGDIYAETYNEEETPKLLEEASIAYKNAGRLLHHKYAVLQWAIALSNIKNYKRALSIIEAIETDTIGSSAVFLAECNLAKISILIKMRDIKTGESEIHKGVKFRKYLTPTSDHYSCMADIKVASGKMDEAIAYLDSAENSMSTWFDTLGVVSVKANLSIAQKNYEKYKVFEDSLVHMQNKIVGNLLRQSVIKKQRNYFDTKATVAENKYQRVLFWGSIVLVVVLVIILLIRFRLRVKTLENIKLMEDYRQANAEVTSLSMDNRRKDDISRQTQSILNDSQTLINNLCDSYFNNDLDNIGKAIILNSVREEITKYCSPENIESYRQKVNAEKNNLIERLQEACPNLSEDNVTFAVLRYSGFSQRTVCLFMKFKAMNTYYGFRGRLIKRIKSNNPKDLDEFLENL